MRYYRFYVLFGVPSWWLIIANLCAGAQNACMRIKGALLLWLSDAGSMRYHRFHALFGVPSSWLIMANLCAGAQNACMRV